MKAMTVDELPEDAYELVDLIHSFAYDSPHVRRDAGIVNRCGPIAFGFAVYLRANSMPGGLLHVTGQPTGFPAHTGHYMTTSGLWVIDWAYRQFDTTAPLPVVYPRARLLHEPGVYAPWTSISGELEADDPLYPDFVDYEANVNPFAYLAPGTDDPEWVTPYDER